MNTNISHTEIEEIGAKLKAVVERMQANASNVGTSKQVREWDSERRKNLLARFMSPALAGNSAAKAEAMARSNEEYLQGCMNLATELAEAERIIAKQTADMASFEALRSLYSYSKEIYHNHRG